jgi:hypothetical protein
MLRGLSERGERERAGWLKLHLQSCLDREVEVVTVKGEAIYGRLVAFSVDVRPSFIILETENSKIFVNLFRVERLRAAKGQEAENTHHQAPAGVLGEHALNLGWGIPYLRNMIRTEFEDEEWGEEEEWDEEEEEL